ncbi:unnamed protein product [Notodromas monacha]|uniref:Uncharacterized protein n=1 Tax=Notodromas monacha TaxID=399045 RepID=A0A7R9GFY8_9CRUS|nr:unnamed protein product [Notodromas monacha]CAG0919405.1 unnamed protein product [Notodromas monacha]
MTDDRMYDLLMRQFDPMNMVFLKTDAAVEMNKQEKRMYEEEAEALKAKIEAAEADILVAREELEEAKKQRERKSEYDALARIIFTLPDREVTRKELQTSEASVQRLKKVKAEYQLMLSEREVLSRDLMFAACQLKRCLKDKPNTVQLSHVDPDVEILGGGMSESEGLETPSVKPLGDWPVPILVVEPRGKPGTVKRWTDMNVQEVEKRNLVALSKLVVRDVIESSMVQGRMLDSDHVPLQQFLVILEHSLKHGLKMKRGLLAQQKRDVWELLQEVEKLVPAAKEITLSVRELPSVRTSEGRTRAWLRLALMQKRLPDYFKALTDHRDDLLVHFYDPIALMMSDDAIVLSGLLLGLNVIDSNLCIKFWKLCEPGKYGGCFGPKELLGRAQSAFIVSSGESARTNGVSDFHKHVAQARLGRHEGSQQAAFGRSPGPWQHVALKNEMDTAMKLLEKDVIEKQDTIVSLRRQLEDIKAINLDMYKKLQAAENSVKHKVQMISRLEAKAADMAETIKTFEAKSSDKQAGEETIRKLGQSVADKDATVTTLESDLRVEKEWRLSLQDTLVKDRERMAELSAEISRLTRVSQEHDTLKVAFKSLERTCDDYERSMEELGVHLYESKLKVDDLKEASGAVLRNAQWADDAEVTKCFGCEKDFSISRRKHHCRACGMIFCHGCSDNTMPLQCSKKPVRVCDGCYTHLLERYSVGADSCA